MGNFFHYLISFIGVLLVLITVHELGHYFLARCAGVKVLHFSLGFGKVIFSKQFAPDGTVWSLRLFPLGGYVKMLGEDELASPTEADRAFSQKSVYWRMAIVAAGPFANFALAVLLYTIIFCQGSQEIKPVLGVPVPLSIAAVAGFENGDQVLQIDRQPIATLQEIRYSLLRHESLSDRKLQQIEFILVNQLGQKLVRHLDMSLLDDSVNASDNPLERLGLRPFSPNIRPVLGDIARNSSAQNAGLEFADEILSIDGTTTKSWRDVVEKIRASPAKPLSILFLRAGIQHSLTLLPNTVEEQGVQVGVVGVALNKSELARARAETTTIIRYPLGLAITKALNETYEQACLNLSMISRMLTSAMSWKNLGGPLTIADYAGQSASMGLDSYLKFMALLSIGLGVLNLLPIPILDGGHLLYYVAEIIGRKPLSARITEVTRRLGLVLLLTLMALAFYNDINRLIVH
ncbi:MAG: RIP metalloprotease RseP [Pseudomonadota bacterium]